jgi:hypothetical protein
MIKTDVPTLFLNHFGFKLNGGDKFKMCGFLLFSKYGMASFELLNELIILAKYTIGIINGKFFLP